jgi:hypothetical protein
MLFHLQHTVSFITLVINPEIGFENDRVITTFIMDQNQFEDGPMSESTLVESILSEGVAA